MASGSAERDALIAALEATGGADGQDFADWAQSLLAGSQVNADILADINDILTQITFT